jgi:TPR repeat protein
MLIVYVRPSESSDTPAALRCAEIERDLVTTHIAQASEAALLRRRGEHQLGRGANSKAFQSFLAAARLGDEVAQVKVGYACAYGIFRQVNVGKAIRWWKRAYRQGSWAAAFNLGMFFRDVKQWAKAVKWFQRAIQAGDKDGLIEIAKIHLRYAGDRTAGLRYLKLAVAAKANPQNRHVWKQSVCSKEQKDLSAGDLLYMEADLLDEHRRYTEALPLLLRGAKTGDTSVVSNK